MQTNTAPVYPNEIGLIDRVTQVEEYVRAVRRGKVCSPVVPLWHLRVIRDQSRCAGSHQVADLCSQIEARIVAFNLSREDAPEDVTAELLDVAAFLNSVPAPGTAIGMKAC
ncbi:MAG: hypothetical protein HUU46_17510 [Candidatus Hydrogenedentes bacterium]|nr:hypothetical protein [Candidatus Hydrogenedentota bacterium]